MAKPSENRRSQEGEIYTLAQSGTSNSHKPQQTAIVSGKGSDLLDPEFLKKKGRRKLISDAMILGLIDIAKEQGDQKKIQSYWNTYHCQRELISSGDRLHGKYCKNRFCTTCCSNRKADLINTYFPIIKEWDDPHFVTLTFKSPTRKDLKKYIKGLTKILQKVQGMLKKRFQRRKLNYKPMWIRSLECNFNAERRTYNPHFHLIVPNAELAELLIKEWLIACRPKSESKYRFSFKYAAPWAQHKKRIEEIDKQLVEVIKYGAKIFEDPDKKNKKKAYKIYLRALDTIYSAMKGRKLFTHFGFQLPKKPENRTVSRVISQFDKWNYNTKEKDWINQETGELLSQFIPDLNLESILSEMDKETY